MMTRLRARLVSDDWSGPASEADVPANRFKAERNLPWWRSRSAADYFNVIETTDLCLLPEQFFRKTLCVGDCILKSCIASLHIMTPTAITQAVPARFRLSAPVSKKFASLLLTFSC